MARRIRVLVLILFAWPLAACLHAERSHGSASAWALAEEEGGDLAAPLDVARDGPHDFAWRLSGDRAGAPLQVFSSPRGVWLQFASHAPIPAVFGRLPDGRETLLRQRVLLPYVFVPGTWTQLSFRAGRRVAQAVKTQDHTSSQSNGQLASEAVVSKPAYAVLKTDANLRRALVRWAALAGWTFEPEHWVLDADIPVSAEANLGRDFRTAVRQLLASTEMSDLPVQPCFYANRVLRVLAYAQQCDPRGTPALAPAPGSEAS